MGLKTGIWTSRLEFEPNDWDLRGTEKKGPPDWNLGLETGIWALGLGFEGGGDGEEGEEEGGGENSPYV